MLGMFTVVVATNLQIKAMVILPRYYKHFSVFSKVTRKVGSPLSVRRETLVEAFKSPAPWGVVIVSMGSWLTSLSRSFQMSYTGQYSHAIYWLTRHSLSICHLEVTKHVISISYTVPD
jgi:hypothetical protein